jgi:hypothetical protein
MSYDCLRAPEQQCSEVEKQGTLNAWMQFKCNFDGITKFRFPWNPVLFWWAFKRWWAAIQALCRYNKAMHCGLRYASEGGFLV